MARKKPSHPGQLDLFLDSSETLLANDIIESFKQRDAACAEDRLRRLTTIAPAHPKLPDYGMLCRALREWPFSAADPAAVAAAIERLETEVQVAAEAVLGRAAEVFMRPFWHGLAEVARDHPYHEGFPQSFSAALYLRSGDVRAAEEVAEAALGQDDQPDLLYWLCLARYGSGGLAGCQPILLRLALVAPHHVPDAIATLADPLLSTEWETFQTDCYWLGEGDAGAWFPAWYYLKHPGMRPIPGVVPSTPETKAFAAMGRLNALEGQGYSGELIAARKRLQELAPELFALYLRRHEE